MHEPTFRETFENAFHLTVKRKSLWILGLLSALIGQWGMGDFIGTIYRSYNNGFRLSLFVYFFDFVKAFNWSRPAVVFYSFWLLFLVVLLTVAVVFIAVASRGAIVSSTIHWYRNREILPLSKAWNDGVENFKSVFFITLFSRVMQGLLLYLFILATNFLLKVDSFGHSFFIILSASIAILLALAVESASIYAVGYSFVGRQKSLRKKLESGVSLFNEHMAVSLEIGLALMFLSVLFLIAIIYASFIAFLPSLLLWVIAGFSGLEILLKIGLLLGVLIYTLIIFISAGIFNAFVSSVWMYLFMKMHHEGVVSRIFNFFSRFLNR